MFSCTFVFDFLPLLQRNFLVQIKVRSGSGSAALTDSLKWPFSKTGGSQPALPHPPHPQNLAPRLVLTKK